MKPAIAPPRLETLYKNAGLVVKASLKFARLLLVCLKTRVDISELSIVVGTITLGLELDAIPIQELIKHTTINQDGRKVKEVSK